MKAMLEWIYQGPKGIKTTFTSEYMPAEEAMMLAKDIEKTGRAKEIAFIDEQNLKWTKKEYLKLKEEIASEPHDITAYFDGSFDLQSMQGGAGAAVYYSQNGKKMRIRANAVLTDMTSNNEAEYASFWFLLLELEALGAKGQQVQFKGDSQVVLKQLAGEWPCYEETFQIWLDRIDKKLIEMRIQPVYRPINRKENEEADQLAGQALQKIPIRSQIQLKG